MRNSIIDLVDTVSATSLAHCRVLAVLYLSLTATIINMEEPQPHDSQNRIIKPSNYRYITRELTAPPLAGSRGYGLRKGMGKRRG